MPKPKHFLGNKNKKFTRAPAAPRTADEYLAAGVDFEEAGEKWRGGDAIKSTRFFVKAISCYEEALEIFPDAFDLAYNKARVQYELTQHPKLLKNMPGSLIELLNTALRSSRYALGLNPKDADALFNTAQILTSIVDESSDESSAADGIVLRSYLEEALSFLHQCLELQEASAREHQIQLTGIVNSMDTVNQEFEDGGVSIVTTSDMESPASNHVGWASVIEPVTNDTLLDTLLTALETLTRLCHFMDGLSPGTTGTIQEYATALLGARFDAYLTNTDRLDEGYITRTNFLCAFDNLLYCSNMITTIVYSERIDSAYANLNLSSNPSGLWEAAQSLICYNNSLRLSPDGNNVEFISNRWKALTRAGDYLTVASKIPSANQVETINLVRGDVEISRYQLGQTKAEFMVAKTNSAVLLINAEKFYRGSQRLAAAIGDENLAFEASVKEMLARALAGDWGNLAAELSHGNRCRAILEEAANDGLVINSQFEKWAIGLQ